MKYKLNTRQGYYIQKNKGKTKRCARCGDKIYPKYVYCHQCQTLINKEGLIPFHKITKIINKTNMQTKHNRIKIDQNNNKQRIIKYSHNPKGN